MRLLSSQQRERAGGWGIAGLLDKAVFQGDALAAGGGEVARECVGTYVPICAAPHIRPLTAPGQQAGDEAPPRIGQCGRVHATGRTSLQEGLQLGRQELVA